MNDILIKIEQLNNKFKKYQMATTYQTLKQVDYVIDYHSNHEALDNNAVVLNIYGLLQSIFVGIDSLYGLVIGLTNNKFYININQNKTLNQLKHIRNDIVGHPTNRKYGQNGIAYSVIDNTKLTYNEFKYYTYIFNNNDMETKETVVNLTNLKLEYIKEKDIIISRLGEYLDKSESGINLDNEINILFNNLNLNNLKIVKDKFIEHYGNVTEHRFYWRLNLIKYILEYKFDDKELKDLFEYINKVQVNKLLEINNEMEKKRSKISYLKIPYLLKKIYRYLNNNESLVEYIDNLHDRNNPYFDSDLNYLLNNVTDLSFLKVLQLLKQSTNNEMTYLIGSTLKNYRKK